MSRNRRKIPHRLRHRTSKRNRRKKTKKKGKRSRKKNSRRKSRRAKNRRKRKANRKRTRRNLYPEAGSWRMTATHCWSSRCMLPASLSRIFQQEQPVQLDAYDDVLLTGLDEQAAPFQGMDGNRHYAQDTVEQLLTDHFDIEIEQAPQGERRGSRRVWNILSWKRRGFCCTGTHQRRTGKGWNTSAGGGPVLTSRQGVQHLGADHPVAAGRVGKRGGKESILSSLEGWSYLSNTVIFHSDQK